MLFARNYDANKALNFLSQFEASQLTLIIFFGIINIILTVLILVKILKGRRSLWSFIWIPTIWFCFYLLRITEVGMLLWFIIEFMILFPCFGSTLFLTKEPRPKRGSFFIEHSLNIFRCASFYCLQLPQVYP